ncbi:phospholipase D-like domain-containing protein [Acidiphilium sp. 37-64-53]|uniref:phospholipase D-like domain-containing protein n=1 Tax=Acidiphilium sp. 37-64-53 TaxID=1970299 RepID=UPI00257D77C6|nr:phospholipase D-like domain-containing protein [Acidiphilium sp. 37-64-53]
MSTAIFLTHIAVASAVTCHILLRKSNVRAAIGWIAVVWLTTVIGILLYLLFGINRVSRRAARLSRVPKIEDAKPAGSPAQPTPSHIRKLAKIGEQITGMPLTSDNRITVYHGGEIAYDAMIEAINEARHSVAMATYIFRYDKIGHRFVEALIAARDRGVAVRVLVDGIGGGYLRDPTFRALRNAGVSCERFLHSWMPWRMPMLNLRNHKKLLIIDGVTSFTGGLNIGDENCGPTTKHGRVDDVHVGICGPVSRQLLISFAQDWTFTTDENLEGERWWPHLSPHHAGFGTSLARGVPSGPDADVYHIETVSLRNIAFELSRRISCPTTSCNLPSSRRVCAALSWKS